jgi:hypothetical protein
MADAGMPNKARRRQLDSCWLELSSYRVSAWTQPTGRRKLRCKTKEYGPSSGEYESIRAETICNLTLRSGSGHALFDQIINTL